MDAIDTEALDGLSEAVQSLLPEVADSGLQRSLLVNSARITPTGIGGFIGNNKDPRGAILGRRVEAQILITLKAETVAQLNSAVTQVTQRLLGSDRVALLGMGILKIGLDNVGQVTTGTGPTAGAESRLSFHALYEFQKVPEQADGIIQEVQINANLPEAPPVSGTLFMTDLVEGSLEWFEIVDDPMARRSRPSQWGYNGSQARIEQLSNIYGGSSQVNANKPGTYLVLRTGPSVSPAADIDLKVRLASDDDDGIGLVFRWQDVDNFYFFVMDSQRGYRLMGKKVAGTFQNLETAGIDQTQGYVPGTTYTVGVRAVGQVFQVYLDGELALQGVDASISAPGRVGFMSRSNNQAYFYRIELAEV